MTYPTQPGITPPAPGQQREEPELWQEDDIPSDDEGKGRASDSKRDPHPDRAERDD